jgi:adenine-specific DNA-methyltransferase
MDALGHAAMPAREESTETSPQLAFPWVEEVAAEPEFVDIQSRRYLGGKSRLLAFLHRIVSERCGAYESFGDLFAGTGVVGHSFNRPETRVLANDYLLCNYVALTCWLGARDVDMHAASRLIAHLNHLPANDDNYVSEQYGDRYFNRENARKIGAIRDEIDRLELPDSYRALALTGLIYAMDRVAHTCGHYDAFRQPEGLRAAKRSRPLKVMIPRVDPSRNRRNEAYREDANALAKRVRVDLLYLDPPYNSRQYSDTYHVLENIVRNDKPELVGVARKRPGRPDRSRYCGKDAAEALAELTESASCRWILFSYNNMSDGDKRSNAILTEERILDIFERRGKTEIFKTTFNSFTAKRELIPGHEERVYLCRAESDRRVFPLPPVRFAPQPESVAAETTPEPSSPPENREPPP